MGASVSHFLTYDLQFGSNLFMQISWLLKLLSKGGSEVLLIYVFAFYHINAVRVIGDNVTGDIVIGDNGIAT